MDYTTTTIKKGVSVLPLAIDYEQLKKIIFDLIDQRMGSKFKCSFFQNRLLTTLNDSDAFIKEANTIYTDVAFCEDDEISVNKILWEMINDRKLIVNLLPGIYYATVEMELIKM